MRFAGKTTLIRCLLGERRGTQGQVSVLGEAPGSHSALKRVGYMPQQLALQQDLTVAQVFLSSCIHMTLLIHTFSIDVQVFNYYGILHNIPPKMLSRQEHYLQQFLGLPSLDMRVRHLSVGNQQRGSMAQHLIPATATSASQSSGHI